MSAWHYFHAEPLISRFSSELYITLLQQLWPTVLVWNPYPIFILSNQLAVKITRPSFSFGCICINSSTCLILSWIDELMKEWMNEWVWKRWKSEWMEEWMNEQVVNKRYIYYGWILSEWVDECPKIADGANELVNIMQFILVTMHMITPSRYMCTYVCLHPTGYVEYTMQIILSLQNCP